LNEQVANYIRENRGRYTKEAITSQLIAAGHDPAAIEEAWAVVNAAARSAAESAGPRTRYWPVLLGLTGVGGVLTFISWEFGAPLATVFYVATVLVVMAIGIGVTRAASSGAWIVLVGLGVVSALGLLWVAIANSVNGYVDGVTFLAAALAAVATAGVIAVHRYQAQIPYLAYALPVLGWLAVTGICVSPLLTGV